MVRNPKPIEREVHDYLASHSRGARVDDLPNHAEHAQVSVEDGLRQPNHPVDLDLNIELGRTQMTLEDVASLGKGSMIRLDKLSGDPVDVIVDGRLIARGEVLVLNEKFCVRVTELLGCQQFT